MNIHRKGAAPVVQAPEATFTGDVRIGGYFHRPAPSRLVGASVSFAPRSRTPWKVNPLGQTLIIISGIGWAQSEGEEVIEIHAGDILWCPPGEAHWEGATDVHPMTYVALQESSTVQFGPAVSDAQYRGPRDPADAAQLHHGSSR